MQCSWTLTCFHGDVIKCCDHYIACSGGNSLAKMLGAACAAAERLGVVAEPEIVSRHLSAAVAFVVLASDGVFEFMEARGPRRRRLGWQADWARRRVVLEGPAETCATYL